MAKRVENCSKFRKVKKQAERANWVVSQTRRGHYKFCPPDKTQKMVVYSGSPSDPRSFDNFVAKLRQNGLEVTH